MANRVSGQGNHGGRRRRRPMLAIPSGEAVGVGRAGRRRGVEPIWGVGEREAHRKGWFHGDASEQRGNGDGRPEKRWGPPMRWQLGWRTTDVARRRGRFWWRRSDTRGRKREGDGEPRTGRAREAASDHVPTVTGALMAWRTRGGRGRSSAPGGRRHPTSGLGTSLRATDPRAPHVSGFQFSEKLKILFPHKKNRYKLKKNLEKNQGGRKSNLEQLLCL
jgi:hypothetical protein